MKFSDILPDVGPVVAYHPALRSLCNSVKAAILLAQLVYWTNKQKDPDGWIYKTSHDLECETGLTYDEQKTARSTLKSLGFIDEKRKGIPAKMHFLLRPENIINAWKIESAQNNLMSDTETITTSKRRPQNQVDDDHINKFVGITSTCCQDSDQPDSAILASQFDASELTTSLDYSADYPQENSSTEPQPAADIFSRVKNQNLPTAVEEAILSLPTYLQRDARLIVVQEALPVEVAVSNIHLIAQRYDPSGALLRQALRDDYAAPDRIRNAAAAESTEAVARNKQADVEAAELLERQETARNIHRRESALVVFNAMPQETRDTLLLEAESISHGFEKLQEWALVELVENLLVESSSNSESEESQGYPHD